jgi:hypothetical protein
MNKFKKIFAAIAFVLAMVVAIPASAGQQDFRLFNRSGLIVWRLFVSPHSSNSWEEDVLGGDVLMTGDYSTIRFSDYEDTTWWDIKIQTRNGTYFTFSNFNLKRITYLYLYYDKDTGRATLRSE